MYLVIPWPLLSRGGCQDRFDVEPVGRDGQAWLGDLDDEEPVRGEGRHVVVVPRDLSLYRSTI